jgi:outer membrane protein TolC
VSTARQIEEIEAEVTYCRDSVALLRARLYRQGRGTSSRLEELQRRLDGAERRLAAARNSRASGPAS